ncbi:MAG: glycosyltransferase [Methylacidiphilales bacterium]|nr:glycosyltransferase [Candidatus Methylacidiphilales bacterium]NJR15844.1 glycosyltransferase [Calothrix sp. CSU_2_0]
MINQEKSQLKFQNSHENLGYLQTNLEKLELELGQLQTQLQQTNKERERLQYELNQTQRELELSNETIAAMETSKFWKLRVLWFKFKTIIKQTIFAFKNKTILNNLLSNFHRISSTATGIELAGSDITIKSVITKKPLVKHSATVDVIICVHNAFVDVKICLESVIRNSRNPYSIILVDDGSQEETRKYLSDFANSQGVTLIRNETAKGYTFAANQGLKVSKANYAILLNSDTIVTPDWLDRIVACGESDPQIGIVGPLSNTASWQSIPEISHEGDWAENKLPEEMSVADMGRLVAEYSNRLYPRIPFLNGFCLAIKRSTIEDIGYFDEDAFGAGYGEENDYCLRAGKAGWQLAIADDAYIYHSQSRSYSNERRKLLCERADKALVAKHGQQIISDGVAICRFDRVLEGIRIRSKFMVIRQQLIDRGKRYWEGKRILIILPITEPGGGGNVIFQEAAAMQKMGVDVQILNFKSNQSSFEISYPDTTIPIVYVEKENQIPELISQYDAVIATLYKSVYWIEPTKVKTTYININNPIYGYYIQDFEPDFFPSDTEEYKIALDSYTHNPNFVKITKTAWNRDIVKQRTGVEPLLIGSSVNLDLFSPRNIQEPSLSKKSLQIAAMIRPSSPRRNAELTMKVLQKIYQLHGDNIEIIIFGCSSNQLQSFNLQHNFPWRNAGIITRPQLAFLLNNIDIFADFSTFQAMGLTAMEAMACGVAVIVPENGGASSFAIAEHNSLIVDTNSQEACLNQLNRLILDEQLRSRLQKQALEDICVYFPEKAAYNTLKFLFHEND